MRRLLEPSFFKLREKASVFLTELHPAPDQTERSNILARLKKRDFDATHHCSAWREGAPVNAFGTDDDGEPSGTAGAPMLRVLEGAELTNVIAICIRWFGGTKLGTGGLVRAYTESLQGAIAAAEASKLLETIRALRQGCIRTPLAEAHLPFTLMGCFPEADILGQDYEEAQAVLRFQLPPDACPQLEKLWQERSRGGRIEWDKAL